MVLESPAFRARLVELVDLPSGDLPKRPGSSPHGESLGDVAAVAVGGFAVEGESPGVSHAPGPDLGSRVGVVGKRIVLGNCVGILAHVDAKNFSEEVLAVFVPTLVIFTVVFEIIMPLFVAAISGYSGEKLAL